MRQPRPPRPVLCAGGTLTSLVLAALASAQTGCGAFAPPPPGTVDEREVSGNYTLTYDDRLTVRLDVAGAVREQTAQGPGAVVDFGEVNGQPARLDLQAFCGRPEVLCPSEAFWTKVAITQPELRNNGLALQPLTVVDARLDVLDAGMRAQSVSGLVDHAQQDRFLLGLGAQSVGSQSCVALAVSLAGGRFTRAGERLETVVEGRTDGGQPCALDGGAGADAGPSVDGGAACVAVSFTRRVVPPGASADGIAEGKVALAWTGGCAFGPFLAGATLTVETGFTGRRTGDYKPPLFTPAPVVLPADAGVDGGR